MKTTLAIFDLDNTLLQGDSDHAWGQFLVDEKKVDPVAFKKAIDHFSQAYLEGTLDIHEYQAYVTSPMQHMSKDEQESLRLKFIANVIEPIMLPRAKGLVAHHKELGHYTMIITATNAFVTTPIAKKFGVETLLATDTDLETGLIQGTPCFKEGKITRLQEWLISQPEFAKDEQIMQRAYFYSDSHNDIPLMSQVKIPVAVDPDPTLKAHATHKQWPIISLRDI